MMTPRGSVLNAFSKCTNSKLARSWLAANSGSRGYAVKSASIWLSVPAAVTWALWHKGKVKGWANVRLFEPADVRSLSLTMRRLLRVAARPAARSAALAAETGEDVAAQVPPVGGRVLNRQRPSPRAIWAAISLVKFTPAKEAD